MMMTLLEAISDPTVQAAVVSACTIETLPAASDLSGVVTISRLAQASDYVAALQALALEGLDLSTVTDQAVSALLTPPDQT